MRRILSFAMAVMVVFLLAFSCGKKARIIPRKTLSKIYMEMFLTDEWLIDYPQGLKTDTTLVYEPVFMKYGYTSDDYRQSVSYYLQDPDRYARILRETSAMIESEIKVLEAQKKVADAAREARERLKVFAPESIFNMTSLFNEGIFSLSDSVHVFVDTAGGEWAFDPQLGRDTIYRGPQIIVDTISLSDTLFTQEDGIEENDFKTDNVSFKGERLFDAKIR